MFRKLVEEVTGLAHSTSKTLKWITT